MSSITLTNDQFKELLSSLNPTMASTAQPSDPDINNHTLKDPAALGPMQPLKLGANKMARLKIFDEWLEEATNRMDYIGVSSDKDKITLLKTWGGHDLVVLFSTCSLNGAESSLNPEDTFDNITKKLRDELRRLVNRSLAMHNLLNTKQGCKSWMEFVKELEDKAYLLDFDNQPYKQSDAVKDAAIFGMSDARLKEKALSDDPDLTTLIKWGQARESGKEGLHCLREPSSNVHRLNRNNQDKDFSNDEEIDDLIESLQVMKLRKAGRYSNRRKSSNCLNCSSEHAPNRCPAKGKECFTCGGRNHFSNSKACKRNQIKFVEASDNSSSESEPDCNNTTETSLNRVTQASWPGVKSHYTHVLKKISPIHRVSNFRNKTKIVNVKIGECKVKLFTDTGSEFTIIPPSLYEKSMGRIVPAETNLRAWGARNNLDVKGMFHTTITNEKGASNTSKVYIVNGYHPEPLLGAPDAENLGFITFNVDGKEPKASFETNHKTCESIKTLKQVSTSTIKKTSAGTGNKGRNRLTETSHPESYSTDVGNAEKEALKHAPTSREESQTTKQKMCIPEKIRDKLNIEAISQGEEPTNTSTEGKKKLEKPLDDFKGLVFDENRIGKLKGEPVHLDYNADHKPQQPNQASTPTQHRDPLIPSDPPYVKEHVINVGDTVLLKQKKSKCNPPYDPDPYTVTETKGHQITAVRDQKLKTRDAQKWKKIIITPKVDYHHLRQKRYQSTDSDNEILDMAELDKKTTVVEIEQHHDDLRTTPPINAPQPENDIEGGDLLRIPERRAPSTRSRRPPPRYRDYIAKILNSELQDYPKSH